MFAVWMILFRKCWCPTSVTLHYKPLSKWNAQATGNDFLVISASFKLYLRLCHESFKIDVFCPSIPTKIKLRYC